MPAKSIPNSKKLPTPEGDLQILQDSEIKHMFPHQIKGIGPSVTASRLIPAASLREVTGLPVPVETRVTPGIGSARPAGRKSVAWKAVVCKDEAASLSPLKNMQMASVTTVATKRPHQPAGSRFSATVGPRGPQGIATTPDAGEHLFGMQNFRMSALGGGPMTPRSGKFSASVRTAPGKQITTREETFKTGKVLKNKKVVTI